MAINRRKFLAGSVAGAAALHMPAVHVSAQTRSITVGGFFDMADPIAKYWIAPFEKEFGVKVFYNPGNTINQISKMRAEKSNPKHSVMLIDQSYIPVAAKEDLIVPLDRARLPNLKDVHERFLIDNGNGVGMDIHIVSLAYNTSVAAPTTWEAMWGPGMKQKVAMASIQHNNWYTTFVVAAHLKSGRPLNEAHLEVEAGFEKLAELKPNLLTTYTNAANAISMVEQGEVMLIGAVTSKNVLPYMDKGVPIKISQPKEGIFPLLSCAALVKNAPEPELAAQFLDFGLSPDVQSNLSEFATAGPVNRHAKFPGRLKGIIPSTPEEFNAIRQINWPFFIDNRAKWTERWNKLMAG